MTTKTSTDSITYHMENGKQVFPCRCGDIHDSIERYAEHECFHDEIWQHELDKHTGYCTQCGKVIEIIPQKEVK